MEGPSVRVIAERLSFIEGLRVEGVSGNARASKEELSGRIIERVYPLGKRLILEAGDLKVVIHFLMYGSYRINERKEGQTPRLSLTLDHNEINFYNCSVRIVRGGLDGLERCDVLNLLFDRERAVKAIRSFEGEIGDLLLDQDVFGGVGNIIKNEALFLARIHPESLSKAIPAERVDNLIDSVIDFSRAFLERRRKGERLKPILSIYRASNCPVCGSRVLIKRHGVRKRRSFFCPACQVLYR